MLGLLAAIGTKIGWSMLGIYCIYIVLCYIYMKCIYYLYHIYLKYI